MRFDLSTLYYLIIGTLLLSSGMLLWEGQARPLRVRVLRVLAAGFTTLAFGCGLALARFKVPGVLGANLANTVMITGYLTLYVEAAKLAGHKRRAIVAAVVIGTSIAWAAAGTTWREVGWNYVSAAPIAVISALTAWEIWRNERLRVLRSHRLVVAFTAAHALLYAGRAVVLPALVARFGSDSLGIASAITLYEGVLYSVGLPAAFMALFREETHSDLLERSHCDYLTGLGNRRWFFEEGERFIRSKRPEGRVFLLAFDLDYFKAINDRFGHATGDEVLKFFAALLRKRVSAASVVARIGGEEFVALVRCGSSAEALVIASGLARSFADLAIHPAGGLGVATTVSIGVAELGVDAEQLSDLLQAADKALYEAKAGGRNRVVLAAAQPLVFGNRDRLLLT